MNTDTADWIAAEEAAAVGAHYTNKPFREVVANWW